MEKRGEDGKEPKRSVSGKEKAFALLLVLPLMMYSGLIMSDLWNWFVVRALDAPTITIVQAIGLSIVVSYFKGYRKEEKTGPLMAHLVSTGISTTIWFIGWIVQFFVPVTAAVS